MSGPRLPTGLAAVDGALRPEAVVEAVEGVLLTPALLARLAAGGVEMLPQDLEGFARGLEQRCAALPEREAELGRLRQAMLDVVVPPTLLYLTLGGCLALSTLAFSFLYPEWRGLFFPAAGGVLLALIAWAVLQSVRSAQAQRRLQESLYEAQDEVALLRCERRRLPALLAAAGLTVEQGGEALQARARAVGWAGPEGDPERPLVARFEELDEDAVGVLARVGRARLVLVLGAPAGPPFERRLPGEVFAPLE